MIRSARVFRLLAIFGLLGSAQAWAYDSSSPFAKPPTPGVFDSFVLAMSHENDFCTTHPSKKECKDGNAATFGMALHGLWPNRKNDPKHTYQYCGTVTASQLDKNWCASQYEIRGQLGDRTFAALSDVMPGVQSCLHNHEWYAHGTCLGGTAEQYFDQSQELAKKFLALPQFNGLIKNMAGKTVSSAQMIAALAADLGATAELAIVLACRKGKQKKSHFTEVRLSLDRNNYMSFPAAESLGKHESTGSDCPAEGITITP